MFSPAAETTTPPQNFGPAAPRPSPPGPMSPGSSWLHNPSYSRASLSPSRFPSICRCQVDGARSSGTASSRSRRGRGPVARAACSAPRDDFLGSRWQERYPGLIPNPQRAENLPSSCAFRPQQFAGNCILCERRLIGEARRALRGDHTGSGTASYSFVSEESGNLDIAIVVRHDLSLLAG